MRNSSPDPLAQRWISRAVSGLADGLVLIDETGHVVFWNRRAEELVHWPADEMVGRRVSEMVERIAARAVSPESVRALLVDALASVVSETIVEMELVAAPVPVELREVYLAGEPGSRGRPSPGRAARFISLRAFPLKDAGGKDGGIGLLLRDSTREREADAMKSQLLSTVSHELRTPLASIKGFATTLLRQDVKWDETTERDFLRIIEDEADRLTEIIDNLLDMSQIEAGALRIDKEPTQLRTLIREVVDEMRMRTEAHWFMVDLPADLPRVLADPRRVRQVLRNLLENAIKYSPGGQIGVNCEVEGSFVIVSVSDQGEGIPPEFLDKVFDRFFQVDGASTRRVGGSGLGLSISRGIVNAHGGRIWAESESGQGSTFRFTLPIASNHASD